MPAESRVFVKGNEAIARGALSAGCACYFGYPITPQNDIPEYMSKALPRLGGNFVQAESEIAAANMLLGAASSGIRAMTSSSSPGISLKQEAISYMAGSELPGVVVNMNRGGPGLGDIGPAQGDYFQATRGGGHGDYRLLVLAPGTVQEAYDLTIKAFDLAFAYRNPVMLLGDAILGQMKEPIILQDELSPDPEEGKEWRLDGAEHRDPRILKSLFLAEGSLAAHNSHLRKKYIDMEKECDWEEFLTEDAHLVVVAFGSIGRIAKSSIKTLRAQGYRVGLLRPITVYPFPAEPLQTLAKSGKKFLTIEHNLGQMLEDVRLSLCGLADSAFYGHLPGNLPTPNDFEQPIRDALEK